MVEPLVIQLVEENDFENLWEYLRNHPDADIQGNCGETSLLIAVQQRNNECIQVLSEFNADPNIRNNDGNTPLIWAALEGYHFECFKLLVEFNANPNIQNNDGETALILATYYEQTECVNLLLKFNADPNIQNNDGETSLMKAMEIEKDMKCIKLLIEWGSDPNIRDNNGRAALWFAATDGKDEHVDFLLKANADPNIPDNDGDTPLMCAVHDGHYQCAKLLLEAGADPSKLTEMQQVPKGLKTDFVVVSNVVKDFASQLENQLDFIFIPDLAKLIVQFIIPTINYRY